MTFFETMLNNNLLEWKTLYIGYVYKFLDQKDVIQYALKKIDTYQGENHSIYSLASGDNDSESDFKENFEKFLEEEKTLIKNKTEERNIREGFK